MCFHRAIPLALCALLIGRAAILSAQDPAPPQVTDTSVQGYVPPAAAEPAAAPAVPAPTGARAALGAQLGFIEILPTRSADRIRRAQEASRSDLREAETDLANAVRMKDQTKAMIEVKKQEISSLDARRKLAEKNKQEAEQVTLVAEKKDAERHKTFLERRVSLHDAEIDRARAAKKLGETTERALELELQLVSRRADRAQSAGVDPAATRRHDAVILELEGKVLESERAAADSRKQVADKDLDIARRRLDLHRAQVAAAGGQ